MLHVSSRWTALHPATRGSAASYGGELRHSITEMQTEPALKLLCTVPASVSNTRFIRSSVRGRCGIGIRKNEAAAEILEKKKYSKL